MSKQKNKDELIAQKDSAIKSINNLLSSYIDSNNPNNLSKADKLSYWLKDYAKFLDYEPSFSPNKLKRYKRGDVVKVHLGYNIGSEEGGLHYCVVIDKNNSIHSPTITVVPLTSIKEHTDLNKLHKGSINLGNSLYVAMASKFNALQNNLRTQITDLSAKLDALLKNSNDNKSLNDDMNECNAQIDCLKKECAHILRVQSEIDKMKKGSIALVSQITTISKIRIYDPKTNYDVLSYIRLSNENLDAIDNEIKNIFIK